MKGGTTKDRPSGKDQEKRKEEESSDGHDELYKMSRKDLVDMVIKSRKNE